MPITIYKILSVKPDVNFPGRMDVKFVLTDGVNKHSWGRGNLPDDQVQAEALILKKGKEYFDKNRSWDDFISTFGPDKDFTDNLPSVAEIAATSDVNALRLEVVRLRRAVKSLSERG